MADNDSALQTADCFWAVGPMGVKNLWDINHNNVGTFPGLSLPNGKDIKPDGTYVSAAPVKNRQRNVLESFDSVIVQLSPGYTPRRIFATNTRIIDGISLLNSGIRGFFS
jgi:hypothetical protein